MKFNLKIIRALLGISSNKLAEELGLSRQTISNWENGRTEPTKLSKMGIAYLIEHKYSDISTDAMAIIQSMMTDL